MTISVRRIMQRVDVSWYVFSGYIPDFQKLTFVHERRALFTTEGLIKERLSMIPGTERALKKTVKELGGWDFIMSPSYVIDDQTYEKLQAVGLTKEQFDKSREYLSDRTSYRVESLKRGS